MRFLGNIEAKTDAKGRAFLPANFRKILQVSGEEKLVLRKDVFQPCLVIYPESVWNEQLDQLRSKLSRWNAKEQQIYRSFIADAILLTLDGNGRFLIPKRQMKLADIEQNIRFVGMGDTIEIWRSNGEEEAFMDSEEFSKALQEIMSSNNTVKEYTEMVKTAETYHVPVLLNESIDGLNIQPGGIYVDVTFGGGGHSKEILARINGNGHLYSFDQDADAERNVVANKDFTFVCSNFRYLKNWMRYYGVEGLDGLLADLGVSSHHFDDETRGFSFRYEDAPLDMRMNKRAGKTAADIVNDYEESQLADIFYLYGELKNSRRIASALVKARATQKIVTTTDFIKAVEPLFKKEREKKEMAKLFQALRIEVNHEMDALKEMLKAATELLKPGGRLSVITYHSLEDRIVKNVMKAGNPEGKVSQDFFGRIETPFKLINNKVIIPSAEEQERNPRSRSAKLRIAEKK